MTIRSKLTLWYSTVLFFSIAVLAGALHFEFVIERAIKRARGLPPEPVEQEITEILFLYAVPVVLLAIGGGWWLTRKVLEPLNEIARIAEKVSAQNLAPGLPRSHNGDELDRLAEVFNSMFQRLHTSFLRERDFTLHASHELKTPLMVMRAQIETSLRDEQLSLEQREVLTSHLEEIVRFAGIVDSLSFLAKADAGLLKLKKEVVPFNQLVSEAIEDTRILAGAKGITVLVDQFDATTVFGDRHRLRQLLLNICDNAVKHNRTGGSVSFSLTRRNTEAELVVENTGPGIPEDQLPRVFDRFYRVDSAHNPNVEGSGLGLSIVKWIVVEHGGHIQIASQLSHWTKVQIRLPSNCAAS